MANEAAVKPVILLVEDHSDSREMMCRTLTRRGYEVLGASSGGDARVIASANHVDLLISDIGLPDGDGCDLLIAMRHKRPTLQAIALTGHAYPADELRCRAAGFGWFLTKPVELYPLLTTIEIAVRIARGDAIEEDRAG